ncbi:hypothetical protein V2G26_016101 [Clonostachys chloroleuca]
MSDLDAQGTAQPGRWRYKNLAILPPSNIMETDPCSMENPPFKGPRSGMARPSRSSPTPKQARPWIQSGDLLHVCLGQVYYCINTIAALIPCTARCFQPVASGGKHRGCACLHKHKCMRLTMIPPT